MNEGMCVRVGGWMSVYSAFTALSLLQPACYKRSEESAVNRKNNEE